MIFHLWRDCNKSHIHARGDANVITVVDISTSSTFGWVSRSVTSTDSAQLHPRWPRIPTAQEQEIQTILDKVHINKERARSDAQYYAAMKEADANAQLLTANYLEYKRIESLSNNTKIYFGDKIPEMYVNNAGQK